MIDKLAQGMVGEARGTTPPTDSVIERDWKELVDEINTPQLRQKLEMFKPMLVGPGRTSVAPTEGLSIHRGTFRSSPDGNEVPYLFMRPERFGAPGTAAAKAAPCVVSSSPSLRTPKGGKVERWCGCGVPLCVMPRCTLLRSSSNNDMSRIVSF